MNFRNPKIKRIGIGVAYFIVIAAILTVTIPMVLGYFYKDRFRPGTIFAGINLSGKQYGESKKILEHEIGNITNKKIVLDIADKKFELPIKDLGLRYSWISAFDNLYSEQNSGNFVEDSFILAYDYLQGKQYNEKISFRLNRNKVDVKLSEIITQVNKEPVDAKIRLENDNLIIDKELPGMGVDKEKVTDLIYSSLNSRIKNGNWDGNIAVNLPSTILEAKIKESDFTQAKQMAEQTSDKKIILLFENKKYTLERRDILKWFSFDYKGGVIKANLKKDDIAKYVASIAKKIDILPREKQLSSKDGSVLQEGKDGRALTKEKTVNDIVSILEGTYQIKPTQPQTEVPAENVAVDSASSVENKNYNLALQVDVKSFATKTVDPPFTPGMYEGKYIEVNLSQQKMYLWEGANLVKTYGVSSGKKSTPTREGIFKIKNKASVGKEFPWIMPWWMAFAQDKSGAWQGFHELPVDMRTGKKEGVSDIGKAVSHGCVRLAAGQAKELYDWAVVGMPVYIHK